MKFELTAILFDSIEYKKYDTISIGNQEWLTSNFTTIMSDDALIYYNDSSGSIQLHYVENNILDLLSQELDVEVNKEMFMKIIDLVKRESDENNDPED